MKKYLLVFTQSFSDLLAYRAGILLQLFQNSLPALITLMVLTFAKSSIINTSTLISYYLFVTVTAPLVISNVDEVLDYLSSSGEINNFLTKPISLIWMFWIKNFTEKLLIFIIICPILFAIVYSYGFNFTNLSAFIISLPVSFTLSYLFSFAVGLGTFWLDEFWAIRNVKFVAIQLLGGLIIPYSVMPQSLQSAINLTFFPYLGSWSGRILQSGLKLSDLLVSFIWLAIMFLVMHFIFKSAVRHYSHTGS